MLFITNRMLKQSHRSRRNRKVTFDLDNNEASQSVFFCRRDGPDDYTEIGGTAFLDDLRGGSAEQLLIYIHGFNTLPEPDTFPRAARLQQLFDASQANLVPVVPIIWPTDNDRGILCRVAPQMLCVEAHVISWLELGFDAMSGRACERKLRRDVDHDTVFASHVFRHTRVSFEVRIAYCNRLADLKAQLFFAGGRSFTGGR